MIKDQKIPDKLWLDKIHFAYYKAYPEDKKSEEIENFIDWLYKQYGYVKPNE